MRLQVIKNRVLFWCRKIFLYSAFIFIVVFTSLFLALQFPSVQTFFISRYLKNFSQVVDFPTSVESMSLRWYDQLEMKQVKIKDPKGNTMIGVANLSVDFGLFNLLKNGEVNIDEAKIDGADVNLVYIPETDTSTNLNINIFIKHINKQFSSGKKSSGASSAKLNIESISLDRSQFSYNATGKDSIKNGFDYNHFHLNLNKGKVKVFQIIGDTIQFDVKKLQAYDHQTKLNIKELQTYFRISQSSMEFLNAHLKTDKSFISDTVIFKYDGMDELSHFNEKVDIIAKLKNTVIDPNELAHFTYGLPALPNKIMLSGIATGKVTRFVFRNMNVAMGKTKMIGRLRMDGLPNINETFIDLKVSEGEADQNTIRFFVPKNVFTALQPLGHIKMQGQFTGFSNDFVAKGNLLTQLGAIQSDVNLKISEEDDSQSTYSGNLILNNFELGNYFNDTINYQNITLSGHVNGKGLTRETADFILSGKINSLGFRKYNYVNIETNAQFARELFNGNLSINDPNLKFNGSAFIDFRKEKQITQIKAKLDTAFIDKLGFINDPLFVRTYCDINANGMHIDSLLGSALLKQTRIEYKNKLLLLDSVRVVSEKDGANKKLTVKSSLADFSMDGNYKYTSLITDLKNLGTEFYYSLKNNRQVLAEYRKEKKSTVSVEPYKTVFELNMHDVSPLTKLGNIDLYVAPHSTVKGFFSNDKSFSLQLSALSDTVIFQQKIFAKNEIEFNASKQRDSVGGTSSLTVHSANQQFSKIFKTKNIIAEAKWVNDNILFSFDADQDGSTNILRLKSKLDFLQDSIRLKILPSQLRIFDEDWALSDDNYILEKGLEWTINHMHLHHKSESVTLDGAISENPDKLLTLTIDSLGIDIINSLVLEKIYGTVNGNVQARDLYHDPFIQNNISIKNLMIDEFLIGNIVGLNKWNRSEKRFDLDFTLERNGKRTVQMEGYYNPTLKVNPLLVKAKLENTNIKIIEPFMRGIFSQMDGSLTGDYIITGNLFEPAINGTGKIESAQLMIDYLKTKYFFSGELAFTPTQIQFKNFKVNDEQKNDATLNGFVEHKNYSKMKIDVSTSFTNFQLLNLSAKDNDLFYGEAFGTGNMNIVGPIDNLKILGTARSEKGTRIFIPLNGTTETVAKKDFITFVKFADSVKLNKDTKKAKTKNEPTGITMDLNLDITTDAYSEIIFDIRTGDIIRGYGKGNIKLQLDTKGEFNMFGDYEFDKGYYNFTLYDIINKEFTINKGSRITWYGDPYEGILAINASYRQMVSLSPIVAMYNPTAANSQAMKRKYPVEVQLKIDGAMLSPQINFDIVANDLPNQVPLETGGSEALNQDFKAYKAQMNEQELKRQVFSLIMLRRFSPQDAFATGNSLYSSVSELFSNQLSYWLTQVDPNLEVNFDLGNFDQEAFNTFQLRFSYSFLNGRLRVTRDGAFGNQTTQSEVSTMLGDWTIDYLLTPDGKFKVKMYSRNNVNQLLSNTTTSQTAITTGFSLMNTQSFNNWKELLTIARERRRKELKENPKKKEEDEEQN